MHTPLSIQSAEGKTSTTSGSGNQSFEKRSVQSILLASDALLRKSVACNVGTQLQMVANENCVLN